MEPNTHSDRHRLAALGAAVEDLAAQDLGGLSDAVRAERVLVLRRLLDRLEGHWLAELATLDARGAAGAEDGVQVGSTASWLRQRLRMGAGAAHSAVRTARALFRGPLAHTATALTDGELSPAHATVLATAPTTSPTSPPPTPNQSCSKPPAASTRPACARSSATWAWSPTPTGPTTTPSAAMPGGGCGWPQPGTAWSPWTGCWRPRPARPSWPPWNPWPARTVPATTAAAANATPTPCMSWPAAAWR